MSNQKNPYLQIAALLSFLLLVCSFSQAATITVKADGSGDYPTIQSAIDHANAGDVVVLEEGTYTGAGNRDIVFKGKAITVRSTNPDDPDVVNGTVIDCERRGRGFILKNSEKSNSKLEGLKIKNGYADKANFNEDLALGNCGGGGILCFKSSPTISKCFIEECEAMYGGGIGAYQCAPIISHCTIKSNHAYHHIYYTSNGISVPWWERHREGGVGGGIYTGTCNAQIDHCIIMFNRAIWNGGGICSNSYSNDIISQCHIIGNQCTTRSSGGVGFNDHSNGTIRDCVIEKNYSRQDGGGIFCFNYSAPGIRNCTITDNIAAGKGAGIFCTQHGNPTITQCIIWYNYGLISPAGNIGFKEDSNPVIRYSDIQGGWTGKGSHNINSDPEFVNPVNDDYHLQSGSPCINSGHPTYAPNPKDETDMDDYPRIISGRVDMGAYEAIPANEKWVPLQYSNIQDAIDAASDGDTVIVSQGTYSGAGNRDLNFGGKKITVRGTDPENLLVVCQTVIDCGGSESEPHRGFTFNSGEGCNSAISGLTITNGYGPTETIQGSTISVGGAIFCDHSSPTISNCVIKVNHAYSGGGGICCYDGSEPTISRCTIKENSAYTGGGICNYTNSGPIVAECTLSKNLASAGGGMASIWDSSPTINDCTFRENLATGENNRGGGMYNASHSSPAITNCIFTANQAGWGGGGMSNDWESSPIVTNCTFSRNSVTSSHGGGISCDISDVTLNSCILWDNTSPQIYLDEDSDALVSYSDVQDGWQGQGNINTDPYFAGPAANDYHLKSKYGRRIYGCPDGGCLPCWTKDNVQSPCIDAGDPGSDYSNERWCNGSRINMGAYGNTSQASLSWSQYSDAILPKSTVTFVTGLHFDFNGDVNSDEWPKGPYINHDWDNQRMVIYDPNGSKYSFVPVYDPYHAPGTFNHFTRTGSFGKSLHLCGNQSGYPGGFGHADFPREPVSGGITGLDPDKSLRSFTLEGWIYRDGVVYNHINDPCDPNSPATQESQYAALNIGRMDDAFDDISIKYNSSTGQITGSFWHWNDEPNDPNDPNIPIGETEISVVQHYAPAQEWHHVALVYETIDFSAIAAGDYHNVVLKSDGSLLAWGSNNYGQCNVPGPNEDFVAVAAGSYHSMALDSNGTVAAWGRNDFGQCDVCEPNQGFTAIAGGNNHSMALDSDGTVSAWGRNNFGQCNVPEPNEGFAAIAAGGHHNLALELDGSISAWGRNDSNQCEVPEPNDDFIAVAAGFSHSMGLKSDGSVVAWGSNNYGECNVPEPNEDFVAIAAGAYHSIGQKLDGSLVVWGRNDSNQCDVPVSNERFTAICGGLLHNLAQKFDGSLAAWGENTSGQCNVPTGCGSLSLYFDGVCAADRDPNTDPNYDSQARVQGIAPGVCVWHAAADPVIPGGRDGLAPFIGFRNLCTDQFNGYIDDFRFSVGVILPSYDSTNPYNPFDPFGAIPHSVDSGFWGPIPFEPNWCGDGQVFPDMDLNKDCVVDYSDLALFCADWLKSTNPAVSGASPAYENPMYKTSGKTIDADLSDWVDADWKMLDQIYRGEPDLAEARFAVEWDDANYLYVAVEVNDPDIQYDTNGVGYEDWDKQDGVEIYVQANNSGDDYDIFWLDGQHIIMGPLQGGGQWAVTGEPNSVPTNLMPEYAVTINGHTIYYEVKIKAYDLYDAYEKGLSSGDHVRFDVVVSDKQANNFGMMANDTTAVKSYEGSALQEFVLVPPTGSCGDWGYLLPDASEDCLVNMIDFALFAQNWLEQIFY